MPLSVPLNPALQTLPVYQPGRPIEDVAREIGLPPSQIIKLASNENPLGPSPRALAAMQNVLQNLHLYPDGNAFYLKERLAARLSVSPAHIILGNGSNELIEFAGHAAMRAGSEVVVSEYCFAVYPIVTHLFGAKLVTVPAREYGHDLPAMLNAISARTSVVFVANPNNPTGTLASTAEVMAFVVAVPEHVLLVMDEAYIDFLQDPADLLPLLRAGKKTNLLLMRTFSKIFGLAGLRLGYGIGAPELIAAFEKIRQPFNINSIAQAGALAALEDAEHLSKTRANNKAGLRFFSDAFHDLKWAFVPSAANFVLLQVGDGAAVFKALQNQGVITRPMGGYGLPGWLRISIGTPAQNLRCLQALREIVPSIASSK